MPRRLNQEEIVTLKTLKQKGMSNVQISQALGVTEGAVRYHCRPGADSGEDGRSNKGRKADRVAEAIQHWVADYEQRHRGRSDRPVNVRALYGWLVSEHAYEGSYRSVLRYIRAHYPQPKLRPFRRIETPPGAQAQVDWKEVRGVDLGQGPETLYAFVMVLSHSRKEVVIWQRRMDQLHWHAAHNEALRRLGGIPAVLRIDNLKTGIAQGAGPWGQINSAYRAYARSVGFHIDACLPRHPEHKGKAENQARQVDLRLDVEGRRFDSLEDFQRYTDAVLQRRAQQRICPATGKTVHETWQDELAALRPIGCLPESFDIAVMRCVQHDCLVHFENRSYSVPFRLCGLWVEVRGCAGVVQIVFDGQIVATHPRHTLQRLLIDPAHYEGEGDERVDPPMPLGRMARRLQEIVTLPVERRPVDLYAALAEVAR